MYRVCLVMQAFVYLKPGLKFLLQKGLQVPKDQQKEKHKALFHLCFQARMSDEFHLASQPGL